MNNFKYAPFSRKQKKILTWWLDNSPVKDRYGIIAQGSIRSGKTLSMSLSFVLWAMENYNGMNFIFAGKTIGAFRRNVLETLKKALEGRGYAIKEKRGDNLLLVKSGDIINNFYLFGGTDESSQDTIQGITAAGAYFDEVALMPQSFVNQATGRCSVTGATLWFNCNPEGPKHWFKSEWVDKAEEKKLIVLDFTMKDNLSLSDEVKKRYESYYSGAFYDRYILGRWTRAEGLVYDMFNHDEHVVETIERPYSEYYVSVDYGTQNATVFLLWGLYEGVWYLVKEYYYSGRERGIQKTDSEFAEAMDDFIQGIRGNLMYEIIDPSAASFKAELRQRGHVVRDADNNVLNGIRYTQSSLNLGRIKINDCCENTIGEFATYSWDAKASDRGQDIPLKEDDHCMDGVRYFCQTVLRRINRE